MTGLFANGEVELYGYRFRVVPESIQESLVSVFPGKITIGDSRRVDDPIASSYVMEDWTGGGLKRWMDPAVDFDRFYWSDCATWFTRQLTLGPRARFITQPVWGDGRLKNIRAGAEYNGVQYTGWDNRLALLDINEVLQDKGVVTGTPDNFITDMRVYRCMLGANAGQSRLVIAWRPSAGGPVSGYSVWDGSTMTAGAGGETCMNFTQWDDKLVKIGDDGALRFTLDLVNWYNLPGQNVVPVSASQVTGLATYPDAMWGLDSLQVATTTGLYFYDDIAQIVRPTRLANLPRLINQGRGITNHKDELYIPTTGVGIDRFSGTTVSAVGLNKDDGLPAAYRGNLQWLASSINFLVAAVTSTTPISANGTILAGDWISYASTTLGTQGYAALYGEPRIGGGWHTLYASQLSDGAIYWTGTSSADNKYRLFFGSNGTLGIIDQYPDIANMLDNTIQEFNATGSLITPWNEMGWSEIQKQAIRQKFGVKGAGLVANGSTCSGTPCNIVVEYGLDYDETTWNLLTTITTGVPAPVYFNGHLGVSLKAIRYRYTLNRCTNVLHTPVLVWSTMTFLKQMDARWGYRFTLDLTTANQGITPADQADLLRRMCDPNDLGNNQGVFRGWVHGKFVDRYVSVSELVGKVKGGNKQSGLYSVALVAFP